MQTSWRVTRARALSRWGLVGAVTGMLAACGGKSEPLPQPASLEIVAATDGQHAPAGGPLPAALAVSALSADQVAVPRAKVRWTVTAGEGATLSDTVTLADGLGRAEVALTLGPTAGTYRVRATLVVNTAVTVAFTATADPPPVLTAVIPAAFAGGDTLQITGTGLSASADVTIAGAPALVVSGGNTSLTVVAPICLAPGAVSVQARVAGAPSNVLQGTYNASGAPLVLAVGAYASVNPGQLQGCATFPAAGAAGAEYLLAPQATAGSPGVSADYRLQGDSVVVTLSAPPVSGTPLPLAQRFHDLLRQQELEASKLPRPRLSALQLAPAATVTVKVGDRRSFQVCSELPCTDVAQFTEVTAQAQYVGSHAALFVDQAAPVPLTQITLDSLGSIFDSDLYDVDTRAFGAESDVDQNGVVIILFTPQVNRLTSMSDCGTSIITGYFLGIDIDPAFQNDSRSNRGEVFYALTPDPGGTVTCALSADQVQRLVPVTFIHEFQHMISYNQHVLVRGGTSEMLWLNEALSHIAEELGGLHFEAQGRSDLFSRFAIGDLYNAYLYLQAPGGVFAFPSIGTGTLEERGAAWLFVRWVLDQYGEDLTRRLVETSLRGAANVTDAVGVPMEQLTPQWFLANYVADLAGFTAPTRLRYTTWHFRTTYQSLHDQAASRFPDPYPLVPDVFNGGTFAFTGTLRAGSGDYFRVVQGAGQRGFTLLMTGPTGGVIPTTVIPRLNVIRIR